MNNPRCKDCRWIAPADASSKYECWLNPEPVRRGLNDFCSHHSELQGGLTEVERKHIKNALEGEVAEAAMKEYAFKFCNKIAHKLGIELEE